MQRATGMSSVIRGDQIVVVCDLSDGVCHENEKVFKLLDKINNTFKKGNKCMSVILNKTYECNKEVTQYSACLAPLSPHTVSTHRHMDSSTEHLFFPILPFVLAED